MDTQKAKMKLGRSVPSLLTAAKSKDEELARRAIEGLGKVGKPETLARLRRLRGGTPRVRKSLAFARSLLAHRHGVKGFALKLPRGAKMMPFDSDRAVALGGKILATREWPAIRRSLRVVKEVLPPADKPPLAFQCGGEQLMLLVNPSLVRGASALNRPLVAAALMKFSRATQQWYVTEYFFSDASRGGEARILGVRPSGTIVHAGRAVSEGENVHADVQSLDSPLAMPTYIAAAVGPKVQRGLHFQALVERKRPAGASKPRVPQLMALS